MHLALRSAFYEGDQTLVDQEQTLSRSIHDTHRFLKEALHDDYADPSLRRELINRATTNLRRQQVIKQQVRALRVGPTPPRPVSVEQIPILSAAEGDAVLHAATEDDLRAVMRRLPLGILDGLHAIHLCRCPGPRTQFLPGFSVGTAYGCYHRRNQTVEIYGFGPEAAAQDAGPLAIYLKFCALCTFAHEISHHFDHMFRRARDRWCREDREKTEGFAESRARDLALAHVIPYIEERYPNECKALAKWMRRHGDIALPLAALLEDPVAPWPRAGHCALRALARSVAAGGDERATRYAFARELHLRELDDHAQAVLAGRLAQPPQLIGALCLSACIAACKGRLTEAEALCAGILDEDPELMDAWHVLTRIYLRQKRWGFLEAAASRVIALAGEDPRYRASLLRLRARAWFEQERWEQTAQDLAELETLGDEDDRCFAAVLKVLVLCRTGRWEQALRETRRLSQLGKYDGYRAELAAARFECGRQFDRPSEAGFLDDDAVKALRAAHHDAWVDRLLQG